MLPMLSHSLNWSPLLTSFFGKELAPDDFSGNSFSVPAVNVAEFGDKYQIEVAAPGLSRDDFKVEIKNNVLIVTSEKEEKKEETERTFHRKEFSFYSFKRSFALPEQVDADQIKATHEHGVLKIDIPKKEEARQKPARSIQIG